VHKLRRGVVVSDVRPKTHRRRDRNLRLLEKGDRSLFAVFENLHLVSPQVGDKLACCIRHYQVHKDQAGLNSELNSGRLLSSNAKNEQGQQADGPECSSGR
jgi:hypothetical protein